MLLIATSGGVIAACVAVANQFISGAWRSRRPRREVLIAAAGLPNHVPGGHVLGT